MNHATSVVPLSPKTTTPVADCRTPGGGLDLNRCAAWAEGQGNKARLQVLFERSDRRGCAPR